MAPNVKIQTCPKSSAVYECLQWLCISVHTHWSVQNVVGRSELLKRLETLVSPFSSGLEASLKVKSIGAQTSTAWVSIGWRWNACISKDGPYRNNPIVTLPKVLVGLRRDRTQAWHCFTSIALTAGDWGVMGSQKVQRVQHKRLLLYWNFPDPVPSLPHTHTHILNTVWPSRDETQHTCLNDCFHFQSCV